MDLISPTKQLEVVDEIKQWTINAGEQNYIAYTNIDISKDGYIPISLGYECWEVGNHVAQIHFQGTNEAKVVIVGNNRPPTGGFQLFIRYIKA